MYTLYYMPGACSLATQVVLRELNQPFKLIHKSEVKNFADLNPAGAVPVLEDDGAIIREGAAIMIHLLEKHQSHMLPQSGMQRSNAMQNIMFANATVHPAYSKLFFLAHALEDSDTKQVLMNTSAEQVNKLWAIVDTALAKQPYLSGDTYSAADIMLTVYSRWNAYFPVEIILGSNVERMVNAISNLSSFKLSLEAESQQQAA